MKIQYASDLHTEFGMNGQYLSCGQPLQPVGDVLLLAGDIGYFDPDCVSEEGDYWEYLSVNFPRTLIVPGNHEFYGGADLARLFPGVIYRPYENVTMHYNDVVRIGDVDFILSTLWAHIPPENAFETARRVNDFHRITCGGKPLTVERFNEEHRNAVEFLKIALARSTAAKRVVVTHHVPTALCMAPEFKGSPINGAFTAELFDLIHDSDIGYWIYGHSHRNMPTVEIGDTKLVCNQLGYVGRDFENDDFLKPGYTLETEGLDPAACFEV